MRSIWLASLTLMAAGCGGGGQQTAEGTAPAPATAQAAVREGIVRFSGRFAPIQQQTGQAMASQTARVYGDVNIAFDEDRNRSKIQLNLTTQSTNSEVLSWAILPGRCGSGTIPLLPVSQFPSLEMSNTGRGEIDEEMNVEMRAGSAYHINVYRGGQTLSSVIACSTLRTER